MRSVADNILQKIIWTLHFRLANPIKKIHQDRRSLNRWNEKKQSGREKKTGVKSSPKQSNVMKLFAVKNRKQNNVENEELPWPREESWINDGATTECTTRISQGRAGATLEMEDTGSTETSWVTVGAKKILYRIPDLRRGSRAASGAGPGSKVTARSAEQPRVCYTGPRGWAADCQSGRASSGLTSRPRCRDTGHRRSTTPSSATPTTWGYWTAAPAAPTPARSSSASCSSPASSSASSASSAAL